MGLNHTGAQEEAIPRPQRNAERMLWAASLFVLSMQTNTTNCEFSINF